MPLALLGGYIAIVFCMTGDGIEQAFLSKYLVNLGFSAGDAALVFTVYGATAALSSWLSGVLADVFTPRRIMLIGVAWWLVFHVLFLCLRPRPSQSARSHCSSTASAALPIRLFFYGFFVWVVEKSRPHELASAIGWTWGMFTIGYGIVGSYLPSLHHRLDRLHGHAVDVDGLGVDRRTAHLFLHQQRSAVAARHCRARCDETRQVRPKSASASR